MSTADSHEPSGNSLQYAPPRGQQPYDDGTIRPILERLNRGKSDNESNREFAAATPGRDAPRARRRSRWPLLAACAVSACATAGLAVAAFAWISPATQAAPQRNALDLTPKPVQTVSFKPDETPSAPAAASPQAAVSAPEKQAAAGEPHSEAAASPQLPARPAVGPKELVALWSGIPADIATQSGAPPSATADDAADDNNPEPPQQAKPSHRQVHAQHKRHHARRHVARTHHAPADSAGASTQEASAQPATAAQSAWQALFGHPVATGGPAANPPAAFQ